MRNKSHIAKIVVEQDNDSITYMALFDDLFKGDTSPEDRNFHEVNQIKPDHCSECKGSAIANLEVLGVTAPMFWVCLECDALHLQHKIADTLEKLQSASGVWTNPEDWGFKENHEFN